jgi:uncharacterized membrane protein YedE/YeeE
MEIFTQVRWSPYLSGSLIGVLSWFTFIFLKKPIGCSTAFARTGGIIGKFLGNKKIESMEYYKQFEPKVDWEVAFVLGIIIGAFISAFLSGDLEILLVPSTWERFYGGSFILRIIAAAAGGIFLGFGARMAGGCTSGHGISGAMQLVTSGWVSAIFFFIGGIITAHIIFPGGGVL